MSPRHQRGIALLVAVIMMAMCTMVAAAITYRKAMTERRSAATFTMEQALQAGMAAEGLAAIVLEDDGSNQRTSLHGDWAQPVGPVPIEGTDIWITAQLEDMVARTVERLKMDKGEVFRFTFSRHALIMDESDNRLMVEIRYGQQEMGGDAGWMTFLLDGTQTDELVP